MNLIFKANLEHSMENLKKAPRRARGRPRAWDDKTAQNTIKSLDRAMEIFEHLSGAEGKSLTAIATEMGQAPATIYRVLVTLEGRGLVEFDQQEQLWYIGPRAFVIGARFLRRTSLVERARPILRGAGAAVAAARPPPPPPPLRPRGLPLPPPPDWIFGMRCCPLRHATAEAAVSPSRSPCRIIAPWFRGSPPRRW